MKNCRRRGARIPDDAAACRFCGARQSAGRPAPAGRGEGETSHRPASSGRPDEARRRPASAASRPGSGSRPGPAQRPGQGRRPKRTRRDNRPYILAGAGLAAVVLAVVLWAVLGGRGNAEPDSGSRPASVPASAAGSGSAAPAESLPPAGPWQWTIEPALDYDSMDPLVDLSLTASSQKYLNVAKGGQTGTVAFGDGRLLLELHEGEPMIICEAGMAHNLPPDIEALSTEVSQSKALSDRGFPFGTHGGHGVGNPLYFAQHPETGALTLVTAFPGGYEPASEAALEGRIPAALPVITLDVAALDPLEILDEPAAFGLARTLDKAVLLSVEYEEIGTVQDGVCPVKQNGAWGYVVVETGAMIAPCEYEGFRAGQPGFFAGGYCPVAKDGRYGYIDKAGALVVPLEFEGATHTSGGLAWVKQNGLWGQIEIAG